jgi:hypothetical protein
MLPQPQYRLYATLLDAFAWYKQSESDNAEQELLDKINRVPVTDEKALERMQKGTELNNLIDEILATGVMDIAKAAPFNSDVVRLLAEYLQGATSQYRTSIVMDIDGIVIELYGVTDYILLNKGIDLKSTGSYELGKYKDSLQRHLYPVALADEGIEIDTFEFLVTDFNSVFKEPYKVNLKESRQVLASISLQLIDFIEARRHLITDLKIFGLHELSNS